MFRTETSVNDIWLPESSRWTEHVGWIFRNYNFLFRAPSVIVEPREEPRNILTKENLLQVGSLENLQSFQTLLHTKQQRERLWHKPRF
jgi:hypothetical protein